MKKSTIIAIVVVLAIIGVGVAVKFSQTGGDQKDEGLIKTDEEENNPASGIGEGEIRLTEDNFNKEIREYKGVALVDMFLPTCPHCQKIGPVISEIAKENQGKYKIGKLNTNLNNNLATEFKIENVPALIFFKDGKEVARMIGAKSKEEIAAKLQEISK